MSTINLKKTNRGYSVWLKLKKLHNIIIMEKVFSVLLIANHVNYIVYTSKNTKMLQRSVFF